MGVGIGDYNLDGHLDLFKTHFTGDTSGLYHNDGKGNFDDVTRPPDRRGDAFYLLGRRNRGPRQRWISGCLVRYGKRLSRKWNASCRSIPTKRRESVFRNLGNGTFEELETQAGAGVAAPHSSRGCAFGDFDNDGDMDILIVNMNEPPSLLRNDLSVARTGSRSNSKGSNRTAARSVPASSSAMVSKVQAQAVVSQSSYYSCNDLAPSLRSRCRERGRHRGLLARRPPRALPEDLRQSPRHPAGRRRRGSQQRLESLNHRGAL